MTRAPDRVAAVIPPGLLRKPTAGVAVIIGSYLGVLFGITDVVGGGTRLAVAVGLAVVIATAFARAVSPRTAVVTAVAALVAGLVGYYFSVPPEVRATLTPTTVVVDTLRLLTGVSILRIAEADTWVLATTPVPTFLAWYLACRARHVRAATAAGGMLGLLVLTGDAGTGATLLGVVGVVLAVGLATLPAPSGIRTQWDTLALLVAVMVVLPATLTIPMGTARPASGGSPPSLESTVTASVVTASVVTASPESLEIAGDVQLSPEIRFYIRSPTGSKWQTAAYDRYTGSGWIRTGDAEPFSGRVDGPPGQTVTIEQTVTVVSRFGSYPAAWKPVSVRGATADTAEVLAGGSLEPGTPIEENETVRITSEVLRASPERLRKAGTDYPDGIVERYTQLPGSTPDRVGDLASRVVEGTDNPYDAALAVERYLPAVKNYSLNVDRPRGNVADAFLFEMQAGYCTYFATTMVAMLRSQGIPARFVTGYTTGDQVADDEWIVRAQDAHAWVQVYFPEHGWVDFDPTPSGEREEARARSLAAASRNGTTGGVPGVVRDVVTPNGESTTPTSTPAPTAPGSEGNLSEQVAAVRERPGYPSGSQAGETPNAAGFPTNATPTVTFADPAAENEDEGTNGDRDEESGIPLPDRDTTGYTVLFLIGLVALAHQTGTTTWASRTVWLHVQPRRDPATDIERAFARLQTLLARQHRERRPGETPRTYLAAIDAADDRIDRVVGIYERARYANEATRAEADEAVEAVDRIVADATPVVGRPLQRVATAVGRLRG